MTGRPLLDQALTETITGRRALLKGAGLAGAGLAGIAAGGLLLPGRARAASTLTVGWVYVGPKNDFGFNQAHHEAVEALRSTPGLQVLEEENVPETVAVEQTMESMINFDGAQLLFLDSFGYFDHMIKVAPKYPHVQFRHQGLLWTPSDPPNTGSYFGYISEALYGCGVASAMASKTGKLGFIAAKPIPAVLRSINSFTLGARSVNPNITVQLIFTGGWSVPVKEAEATNSLADNGVDGVACHIDNLKVVLQTADQRGIHSCGLNVDQRALAPKGYLTGALYNWKVPYGEMIMDAMGGKPIPHVLKGGFAENFVRMGPFGTAASPAVRSAVTTAAAELASGKRFVFSGPLKDNRGNVILASGQHFEVDNASLSSMNYLVEGVNGSIS
jgi:basic membrane protein A